MTEPDQDFIIEFINIGNVVKVTAVCTKTGREVSIVGNPKASQHELKTLAVKKLQYVMAVEQDKQDPSPNGRGIII